MAKVAFMGAGSTVFAKSILGDTMMSPALHDCHVALYDIDPGRLADSRMMMENLNANVNGGRATVSAHLGVQERKEALRGAAYVVNAVQVGGYEPATVADFEIPKKYGLRQTIADTLGIGGIMRALRTIPVMLDFAREMQEVCPGALLINYTNPMAMVTGGFIRGSGLKAVGLCHSVQGCAGWLLRELGIPHPPALRWHIAGINHQAWLLEISDGDSDLYPEIKRRAREAVAKVLATGGGRRWAEEHSRLRKEGVKLDDMPIEARVCHDLVRLAMMLEFGYYVTESSEHTAEYVPHWIKRSYPELIDLYNIPLDEYPRRCVAQIAGWKKRREELVKDAKLTHRRGGEFGSYIMEAMETGVPIRVHGNVMNTGIVTNLPSKACVEVPCLVDRNGVQGAYVGDLPEQCAAINRTSVNVQILTVEAALRRDRDLVYQAAMLDPHTAAELSIDDIRRMCDELIEAHGNMMPGWR